MKSFKQHITELFNDPLPFKKHLMPTKTRYAFNIPKVGQYDAYFEKEGRVHKPIYQFYFEDPAGTVEISNVGHKASIQVFSTVAAILKDFIETKGPKKFYFDADKSVGKSRTVLYHRLAKMIEKQTDYKLIITKLSDRDIFKFER